MYMVLYFIFGYNVLSQLHECWILNGNEIRFIVKNCAWELFMYFLVQYVNIIISVLFNS